MSKKLRVLNLGAGVQSTTLYLWAVDGLLDIDVAIFADTGDEPQMVYDHLEFLKSLDGPAIEVVRASDVSLGDNQKIGMCISSRGRPRHIGIPVYLKHPDGSQVGNTKRECTSEYKIEPIHKRIRELIGLGKYKRAKEVMVTQIFGLSFDEPRRVANVKANATRHSWSEPEFPLFDEFMTRADCVRWLEKRLPDRKVPRSACVFCPYKSDAEWVLLRDHHPNEWARAVEVDKILRDPTAVATECIRLPQFLHRSCVPLDQVEFKPKTPDRQKAIDFTNMDCEGMCGV